MSVLMRLNSEFEGHKLTTIEVEGKTCWLARDIGKALGYDQDGRRFVNQITDNWADEFIPGTDYLNLSGERLQQLKDFLSENADESTIATRLYTDLVSSRAPKVLILFESGVFLSCLKTTKPTGRRLRRFLSEEVLPQIVRTGEYQTGGKNISEMTDQEKECAGKYLIGMIDQHFGSGILDTQEARRFTVGVYANLFDEHMLIQPSVNRLDFSGKPFRGDWALYKFGPEYGFKGAATEWTKQYELFLLSHIMPDQVGGSKLLAEKSNYIDGPRKLYRWAYPESLHRIALPWFLKKYGLAECEEKHLTPGLPIFGKGEM